MGHHPGRRGRPSSSTPRLSPTGNSKRDGSAGNTGSKSYSNRYQNRNRHLYLLLTISLAEFALLNDAGRLSGDAPHFRRKALPAPP